MNLDFITVEKEITKIKYLLKRKPISVKSLYENLLRFGKYTEILLPNARMEVQIIKFPVLNVTCHKTMFSLALFNRYIHIVDCLPREQNTIFKCYSSFKNCQYYAVLLRVDKEQNRSF